MWLMTVALLIQAVLHLDSPVLLLALVALQSAAGGILGGSRMQHHLRQSLTSVDVILFGRPEVIVTFAAQKFDEKTLELKDQTAIDLIKQQLAGFEKFIRRLGPKE